MRTDTNVADGDTPPAGAAMNGQFDRNLFVFDRARTADGLLFVTGGDRCRYLGKSSREKPDWLKQNEGRYRRVEDVLRVDAPRMPFVEAEINLGAGPVEPADSSSSPEIRNDSDDKDDIALADALLGDCSRPCEPISPPTPVKESAEKKKPPAGIARSTPKLCPELMLLVLDALAERPFLYRAANKAGIHRKTLAYWIRRSEAGDNGYDIKWQGIEWRFHELCKLAIDEAHQKLEDEWIQRALHGYEKVLTHRGRVMYKIDQDLVGLGLEGPDAYLEDENRKPVPETVHKEDTKAQLHVLKRFRPNTWAKRPKIDAPREGVLVIGDATKKPKCNTAKSVRARKWKADSRRIREEKE
jgi:hypothetical protein